MYDVSQNVIRDMKKAAFLETMFNFYPTGVGIYIFGHG